MMRQELSTISRMLAKVLLVFYLPVVAILTVLYFPYATDPSVGDKPRPVALEAQRFYEEAYQPQATAAGVQNNSYVETAQISNEGAGIRRMVQRFIQDHGLRDKKILEVGSGVGALQDLVPDYTGLDISHNVAGYYHKPFFVASATAMPFPDNTFDAIWTIWVLEHVPEPQRMLEETRRVLKPAGLLFLLPAWNVPPWASNGYEVRPYRDFAFYGKVTKASIPIRKCVYPVYVFPIRFVRLAQYQVLGDWTRLRFHILSPNYGDYQGPDSDAAVSLDSYEAFLWFRSRGDDCLNCDSAVRQGFRFPVQLLIRIGNKVNAPQVGH